MIWERGFGAYFDIIIDDSWKIRWMPIIHVCSHAGGDYLGDPLFDDTKNFTDMGNENMSFALYRNWHWFIFALKYKPMRSRQVISYKQIEKRFGFETTVYF